MTTYRDAVRRLQIIYADCAPQAKENKNTKANLDDFTRLRKDIHSTVKQTRIMLKEREELLGVKTASKEGAELSARIRTKIKGMYEDLRQLKTLQEKEKKKFEKSTDPETVDRLKEHQEVVDLVKKHIEEVENLEKKRIHDKTTSDRSALFAGANPTSINMVKFNEKPTGPLDSNLPDIDNDPEVGAELMMLQQNDKHIDQDLEQIGGAVNILKQIAIDMDREIDKQNAMIDNIDKKVDHAQEHLDKVNVKMKEALDGMMKGDKFMVTCILLCVLLGLFGFISQYFIPSS